MLLEIHIILMKLIFVYLSLVPSALFSNYKYQLEWCVSSNYIL